MTLGRLPSLALLLLLASATARAKTPKACFSADQATRMINKDVCINVHVYDVVQLDDGTRFLDVCSPDTPDDRCRFTIVSLWQDRGQVGELQQYRDQNVRIRGLVEPMDQRFGMMLSERRQFYGGPPKFRPNPLLAHGFGAEQSRPAVRDPNLSHHGGRRSFMNSRMQETLPAH